MSAPEKPEGRGGIAEGLAPGFLIASPSLLDPNFERTLVLMAEHGEGGALGFVLNRPAPFSLETVLQSIDPELSRLAEGTDLTGCRVVAGGPVQPDGLWILYHRHGRPVEEDSMMVDGDFALGASRELLESFIRGERPGPFYAILGFAGWGPHQIEQETAEGSWLPLGFEPDLVFDVPFERRWDEAVRRLGLEPGTFLMGGPGAKA